MAAPASALSGLMLAAGWLLALAEVGTEQDCLRPACTRAPQLPEEVADLLVGPGGEALATQCHTIALPCNVPDMGVHRHRLRLVQGQQAHTVGHLGTYTRQGTQHPPGLSIRCGAELAQPLGAEPLSDGPCSPTDKLGPVSKAQCPQPGLGISTWGRHSRDVSGRRRGHGDMTAAAARWWWTCER